MRRQWRLAVLCKVPTELIEHLAHSRRTDALLVPCKAADLGWPTVRVLLDLRSRHNAIAGHDMDFAMRRGKLSQSTAARVLRFWQVRQTTAPQAAEASAGLKSGGEFLLPADWLLLSDPNRASGTNYVIP